MFKKCELSEHKALEREGLKYCPRCKIRLRTVIPYGEFREARKTKKYGSSRKQRNSLKAKGYPDDFTFGPDDQY